MKCDNSLILFFGIKAFQDNFGQLIGYEWDVVMRSNFI